MELLNKLFGSEENVIQIYDPSSRSWSDEGIVEDVTGPEEYDLEGDGKRRLICRKKGKIKNIMWTTTGTDEKPKTRTRQKKRMSDLDSIQSKADSIRKDRKKLLDVKDAIEEIMGGDSSDHEHEEWQYPSMMTGLNRGIGHAFLTGMDEKKGDIAEAGLEMVRGFSNVMSAIPIVAVAYAKSKGVNVGLFGIDEQQMLGGVGNKQPPASAPQEPANEGVMVEHDGGFDIDTIQEEDDYVEDECVEDDDYMDIAEPEFDSSKHGEPDPEQFDHVVPRKLATEADVIAEHTPGPEGLIPESITDEEAAELFEDEDIESLESGEEEDE